MMSGFLQLPEPVFLAFPQVPTVKEDCAGHKRIHCCTGLPVTAKKCDSTAHLAKSQGLGFN